MPHLPRLPALFACLVCCLVGIVAVDAGEPVWRESSLWAGVLKLEGPTARVGKVHRVLDGDTLEVDVVLADKGVSNPSINRPRPLLYGVVSTGQGIVLAKQKLRVLGLDAHEMSDGKRGEKARDAVVGLLRQSEWIWVIPEGDGKRDAFGRLLGRLVLVDKDGQETDLSQWMIAHGHGAPWKK